MSKSTSQLTSTKPATLQSKTKTHEKAFTWDNLRGCVGYKGPAKAIKDLSFPEPKEKKK